MQYQNAGEVCNVYKWSCDDELRPRSSLMLTPETIVILFTQGLPRVRCTKNHPTSDNYIANYKIFKQYELNSSEISRFFQEQYFKFQEISRSCRHPALLLV